MKSLHLINLFLNSWFDQIETDNQIDTNHLTWTPNWNNGTFTKLTAWKRVPGIWRTNQAGCFDDLLAFFPPSITVSASREHTSLNAVALAKVERLNKSTIVRWGTWSRDARRLPITSREVRAGCGANRRPPRAWLCVLPAGEQAYQDSGLEVEATTPNILLY